MALAAPGDAAAEQAKAGAEEVAAATGKPEKPLFEHYADLWERIRSGYRLPDSDDPLVRVHERWFAANPEYFKRNVERARLYLHYIVEELEKRDMPLELALLPAIESAYRPDARSPAHAVGLWQFIAPTARRYGVQIDWWYDGRRDVIVATRAALDYLQELNEQFDGDWSLALAAYNAGEGGIRRLIRLNQRRGRPTEFRHLRLRAETRNYVPRLKALANVIQNPAAYGIELDSVPDKPYFAAVEVDSQIDLNVVAELADVSVADLYQINAGLNRRATPPDGPHRVLVPVGAKEILVAGLSELTAEARVIWRRHHVRPGDTLGAIARTYGVSVPAVQRANDLRGTLIRAGRDLLIPVSASPLNARVARTSSPRTPPGGVRVEHRVREGESLWSIARRYGVRVSELTTWNTISALEPLQVDQRLHVWTTEGTN